MGLRVVLYEAAHEAAVRAFNDRLRAADALLFPLTEAAPAPNPNTPAPGIEFRHFVVVDDGGEVRGGYFLRNQPFVIRGQTYNAGHYNAPLSEGIIDKRFAAVGAAMLSHALAEQPLLFAMGMGGVDRPLPRMLRTMGWSILETPFYFLVLNGKRFLRNAGPLRTRAERRMTAEFLAFSGLGGLALRTIQAARTRRRFDGRYRRQPIRDFSGWVDRIWLDNSDQYSLSAVRNADYLRYIYPLTEPFYGVQLTDADGPAGWVQMLDCELRDRSYFGEMRVAALVDGVGPPAAIASLIQSGVEAARARHADIVISNQMHRDWTAALEAAGFWRGPSNYLLALSKGLRKLLEPLDEAIPRIHFNRGDGDGRVNLYTEPS
ncbi:MAG TPA: hypothetical protein VMR62_36870 [Bryobacteraceae bacterium]|jgi:hypothetical protein|nr:hypothetical protein [Bryobacteraceae bacterium]